MHHPTDRITYTMAFDTPVVEHWLERELMKKDACPAYGQTYNDCVERNRFRNSRKCVCTRRVHAVHDGYTSDSSVIAQCILTNSDIVVVTVRPHLNFSRRAITLNVSMKNLTYKLA